MKVLQKICEIVHLYKKKKYFDFGIIKVMKWFDSFWKIRKLLFVIF